MLFFFGGLGVEGGTDERDTMTFYYYHYREYVSIFEATFVLHTF